MFLILLIFFSKYSSKHILLSSNSLWRDHDTSKKIYVDWHGSRFSLSCTSICASQHWFIVKILIKILIKIKLVYGCLRQQPGFPHHSPPLCLPSLARLSILPPILSPVELQLPAPKDGTGSSLQPSNRLEILTGWERK